MDILTPEQREQLLAKLQAIPDGAHVEVRGSSIYAGFGDKPYTVRGEIFTVKTGQRFVGDTTLLYDGGTKVAIDVYSVEVIS